MQNRKHRRATRGTHVFIETPEEEARRLNRQEAEIEWALTDPKGDVHEEFAADPSILS